MARTQLSRIPEKARTDLASLHALLDDAYLAHVGLVADGGPVVVPTACVRDGDRLLIHGSTGSRWMRALAAGADACVTVTALDGVVVARSAFESSFQYRSAVLFGRFDAVGDADKAVLLDRVVERLLPGRGAEVRPSTRRELAATLLLAMPITEWSLKVSDGWPEDEPDDVAGDAWAGVVPLGTVAGPPVSAPDLRPGIPVPPSVLALGGQPTADVGEDDRRTGQDPPSG
jgi:nitroimidazol reductase NimA-like FMN-containing flavoprotein (pyridoxamine 5'-phosphate oxidase superfamily)